MVAAFGIFYISYYSSLKPPSLPQLSVLLTQKTNTFINGNHCIIMATKTTITYVDHCCFGLHSLSFFGKNLSIKNKTKTRSPKLHHYMKLFFSFSLSSPRHELLKIANVSLYCSCACINFSYTKSNIMLHLYGTFFNNSCHIYKFSRLPVCQFLINCSVDEIDHDDEVCIDPLKR